MSWVKNLWGSGVDTSIVNLLKQGAIILDVRTHAEYQEEHVPGSLHIPLHALEPELDRLKELKVPLVVCCASGKRSGQACELLKGVGIECENGQSWKKALKAVQVIEEESN